ncbi:MAG: GNAT family N-acetyltransferase [Chloroflexota bacterium]
MSGFDFAIQDFRPGALGWVTQQHGAYYAQHWGFHPRFEIEVAREMAEFFGRFAPGIDGFWVAVRGEQILGSITIDGSGYPEQGARLRWFILGEEARGLGIGRALMEHALGFCRQAGHGRVFLWTMAGLAAARHLYDAYGFTLTEEVVDLDWGPDVRHQRMALDLGTAE